MTVIFSALIIICGLGSAVCFISGSPVGGIVNLVIVVLSIVALLGRILSENGRLGMFASILKSKDSDNTYNNVSPIPTSINSASSDADELKKYKELLDQGAITQEEYEAKKKQILGL